MSSFTSMRRRSSTSMGSEPSTPAHSPETSHIDDRLNSLLASFDAGTHSFCRAERTEEAKLQAQSTVPAPKALPTSSAPTTRRPLLSMLSLTRPSILKEPTRHFDPSREPKLHGLP
ncbi:uncharacterized protein EHS24_002960 [Apiotrichum porosum]|uniref:Uncharacterized protein n=1 Tax=Apiotrichum porosum TaxID=105984 RepID=A0A427XG62_9TREE|nr:uncharacterized protein EHS24_002960 [Apiotrichum porosum]RSH77889.1 hypothetical protein EHS24_002960 [Apiotrichum porosum]